MGARAQQEAKEKSLADIRAPAAAIPLPQKEVDTVVGKPTEGSHAAYSGTGDSFDSTVTRTAAVPTAATTRDFDAWYDIEQDRDYAFLEVSTDNGTTWNDVSTSVSDAAENDLDRFNSGGTASRGAGRPDDWYSGRPAPRTGSDSSSTA